MSSVLLCLFVDKQETLKIKLILTNTYEYHCLHYNGCLVIVCHTTSEHYEYCSLTLGSPPEEANSFDTLSSYRYRGPTDFQRTDILRGL
jgi:hypothetical protein